MPVIDVRKIKAVIFDQDGLMFDTERISKEAWHVVGGQMGIQLDESFLSTIRGANSADVSKRLSEKFGDKIDTEELRTRKYTYFRKILKERELPVKTGLYELLSYLKENGYKIALATSSTREYSLENLKRAEIESYFKYMVTGNMVKQAKPNPELFLKAAMEMDVPPSQCMVLEDSINGVEAGVRGGFLTVMVPDLTMPDKLLNWHPHRICDSLLEVRDWIAEETKQ